LSLLLLMRAVDHRKYSNETMSCIEKLTQVDPMRLNYYKDCRKYTLMYVKRQTEYISSSYFLYLHIKIACVCTYYTVPIISYNVYIYI